MFCCKSKKKGRHSIEAYRKIKSEDKKEFMLNALGGSSSSPDLIERINSNKRISQHPEPTNQNELQSLFRGSLEDYIKKKILKSEYDDLIKKYSNSNEMWTDPDFPPTNKSFGPSNLQVVWKRAAEIIQKPSFVSDNFTPSDILQGKLGNCYFLSAIAGIAQKPYRIKKIFPNPQLNKNGIYMARILHKGVYQEVVVDDYFPCTPNGQLIGAQPAAGSEIWVMILQKCWAKVFGSYVAVDGGLPNEVLHCFSSAPTYNYRVTNDKQQLENLWQKMMIADKKDQIICCGTQMQTKKSHLTQLGLVGGHAYTILGVYQESYRILKIRNPWGNMQWKGPASDNDKNFWSKISVDEQLRLGYNTGDDGTFFMLYQDFQKYFIIVDICQINDNANYFYIQNSFSLSKPQCFDLNTDEGDLTISITQTSKRQLKARGQKNNLKYAQVVIILARNNGNNQFEYVQSRLEQNSSDCYLSQPHLPAGKYILCCYVEGNNAVTDATVGVYSQSNLYIIQSGVSQQDFLHRCFLNHARNNQSKQILSKNPLQWICLDILAQNCGIGYSAFHLDPTCTRKIGLQFDQSQYQSNSLDLLPPFKGTSKFKLICNPGQQLIVLCRLKPGVYASDFTLPAPKMYRLK